MLTLKPRLSSIDTRRVKTLDTKAGATVMQRGGSWMAKRLRVALAYNYRCAMCGLSWLPNRDEIDHIIPREQGGSNDELNLQPLCKQPCHALKSASEAKQRSGV